MDILDENYADGDVLRELQARRLRELRDKNGYSQKHVADYLGITSSALSQYENGKRGVKNDILISLANYYKVSADFLLGRSDNPIKVYEIPSSADKTSKPLQQEYTYEISNNTIDDSDLNSSKTRVLAAINRLPKSKQMEVLTAIELLLGTIVGN